jgi:hypothetical protein
MVRVYGQRVFGEQLGFRESLDFYFGEGSGFKRKIK